MLAQTLALALALTAPPPAVEAPSTAGPPVAPPARERPAPPPRLAADERMDFVVDYLGLKAGKARISVGHAEGALVPVFLEARTAGLAGIIDVRQQLASYIDAGTGLPSTASMDSVEPNYRRLDTIRFDREANTATIRTRARHDSTNQLAISPGAVDFIAMVFRLRALPLEPGTRHAFQVITNDAARAVEAVVEAREVVDTDLGKQAAIRVRVPTGFTGKFSEKNPTFIWFSDDARRVVVRISTDFAIGRAVARLVAYQPGAAAP